MRTVEDAQSIIHKFSFQNDLIGLRPIIIFERGYSLQKVSELPITIPWFIKGHNRAILFLISGTTSVPCVQQERGLVWGRGK